MKNLLIFLFAVLLSANVFSQTTSNWERDGQNLQLNATLLGKHYAQGVFYGAAGYGTGMWLSDNKTGWGIVGSLIAVNLPILFEKKFNEPEVVIGRNLGAATLSIGATFYIEMTKKNHPYWSIEPVFKRRR